MSAIIEILPLIAFGYFSIGVFVFLELLIDYKNKTIYQKIGISLLWGLYATGIILISVFVGICDFGNKTFEWISKLLEISHDD